MENSKTAQNDEQRLRRAGAKYSLISAGLGLLIAALITTVVFGLLGTGLHEILFDPYFRAPIAVAVITLGVGAWLFGRVPGSLVFRFGSANLATVFIGIILAMSCLVISVSAGYLTHFFSSIHKSEMLSDYVIGPAIAMIGIGSIPALVLGLGFSAMIQSEGKAP